MKVQINTDSSIDKSSEQAQRLEGLIRKELRRFDEHITRVEVHLSDVNKQKGGSDDKRCLIEARFSGLAPIAASHQAVSIQLAFEGATEKLKRALESAVERRRSY